MKPVVELIDHLLAVQLTAEASGCRIREWRLTHEQIKQL